MQGAEITPEGAVKQKEDMSLAELEAAVQFALHRLVSLHERHLADPSLDNLAALKVATGLWEAAKQELKNYRARS
jgi:hypothetical protein